MQTKIFGNQSFQVLSDNFSISPSAEGYTLQISADGVNFSDLFAVGAGVTRMVTGVASGSYYRANGNQSEIQVNWERSCGGGGGGTGDGVSSLNGQRGALNIKTINGNDLLGTGDIKIEGGEGKKQFVLDVISSEEGSSVSQEAYDEAAAYLKANGLDSADVLLNFGGGTVVELVSKETAGEEGELFVGYGFYFQDAIILEGTEVLMEPISEGGEGGDYKIVDSLPEDAEDGTMIYLTNEVITREQKTLPLYGQVINFDNLEEAFIMANASFWGEPNQVLQIRNDGWGLYYRAEWVEQGWTSPGNSKILTNGTWTYSVEFTEDNKVKVCLIECTDGSFYDFTWVNSDNTTVESTFDTLEVITGVYKPGNYLRKNGKWISSPIIPTLKQGTPFTEDEFNTVLNAYKEGKLYKVLANVDGNFWECHITKFSDDWFEASTSGYYNGDIRLGLIRFHTWGDDGIEWMDFSKLTRPAIINVDEDDNLTSETNIYNLAVSGQLYDCMAKTSTAGFKMTGYQIYADQGYVEVTFNTSSSASISVTVINAYEDGRLEPSASLNAVLEQ